MKHQSLCLVAGTGLATLLVVCSGHLRAAEAPKSPERLREAASHVVTGEVTTIEVRSKYSDIEEGGFGKNRDSKAPENCEIKNMNVTGNTATYTMECKGQHPMKADNKITFVSNGFDMDMKMQMNQGGQVMNMNQKMQGRLVGPCKK